MKVRVIGAGALGMLIAASLAEAGVHIELVTRGPEQAERLSAEGLQLLKMKKKGETIQHKVTVNPCILAAEDLEVDSDQQAAPDLILLMVKQTAVTDKLAQSIAAQMNPETALICFQNGIGHTEILSRFIPIKQIWIAVTTEGALRHHFHCVEHTGSGITWLGPMSKPNDEKNLNLLEKKLQNMFQDAGFSVSLSNKITSKVWNKLLINSVINPLTAILQIPNGMLTQLPAIMPLMQELFEEGVQLANKLGIELADDLWEQLLTVCELTAANQSSMLQDVRSCRLTELDSITGGLLTKALQAGMELPSHRTVYQLVRSIEQQWKKI